MLANLSQQGSMVAFNETDAHGSVPDLHKVDFGQKDDEPDLVDMLIFDKYEFTLKDHQDTIQ
jgi:hypothetical protein